MSPSPEATHAWPGLDKKALPRHVAVVMDGNRRWAKRKLLGGFSGHKAGVETVRVLLKLCRELGIGHLTIYAFSTENWRRSDEEVGFLMGLFEEVIRRELDDLDRNGVRLRFLGDLSALPSALRREIAVAEERTAKNDTICLNVAANYGGRADILNATKALAREVAAGRLDVEAIDEACFAQHLTTAGQPDPDLFIRTSGEARLSNFLLWQAAYTELYFTETLWPEFRQPHFLQALLSFQHRERRLGGDGGAAPARVPAAGTAS